MLNILVIYLNYLTFYYEKFQMYTAFEKHSESHECIIHLQHFSTHGQILFHLWNPVLTLL